MTELTITHLIDVLHNKRMQSDVAYSHAADARRYVAATTDKHE